MRLTDKQKAYIRKSKNSKEYLAWQFGVNVEEIEKVLMPKAPAKKKVEKTEEKKAQKNA